MTLKRGVLFPENQKEDKNKSTANKKPKTKVCYVRAFIQFLNEDQQLLKVVKFFLIIIGVLVFLEVFTMGMDHLTKITNRKHKLELIQTEINSVYKDLNTLKTYKTSRKMKIKMRTYLKFKIDSLATVRDNLKIK
jgi:hypothetical protein